jgi:hypothetical protein
MQEAVAKRNVPALKRLLARSDGLAVVNALDDYGEKYNFAQ